MEKFILAFILFFLLSVSNAGAQKIIEVDKKLFRLEKEGFRDAWRCIKDGDYMFEKGEGMYPEAIISYLIADEYNSENAALNYNIGVCYLFGSEPLKSLDFFLKAYDLDHEVAEDVLLLTGKAYQLRGDYGKAIDCFNMYSDRYYGSGTFDKSVTMYINQCNLAIEMSRDSRSKLINAGVNINSEFDDYSPVLANEGKLLYFTSRRSLDERRDRQESDMKWDENIFVSTAEDTGWSPAGPAGDNLTTALNEGILSVAANGQLMYIYAGYEGNGDILVSEYERGQWTKPVQPGNNRINSKGRETSVTLTDDGNEMFFVSDAGKGQGGRDIYFLKRIRRNRWTRPFNLGEPVNSEYNEESVCISGDGDTIWFSSNRPGGIGGYDIYMSVKDDTGLWSDPVNLGMPANSQAQDLFYKPSPVISNEAWLASDRPGGSGGFDIYRLITEHIKDTIIYSVPDTLTEVTDSLIIKPDTLTEVTDSLIIKPDTLTEVTDSLIIKPDTLTEVTDSLIIKPDTLTEVIDSLIIKPDTLALMKN